MLRTPSIPRVLLTSVAAAFAATIMVASPASAAAPVTAGLVDGCAMVSVTYTGADAAGFSVQRDGVTVQMGTALTGGPWNFSVFAQAGQVIELTGAITGSITHVKPEGCTEPKVSLSIEDRCQGTSAITFHNTGGATAPGLFALNRGDAAVTLLPPVPAGDSVYLVDGLSEYQTYAIRWAPSETAAAASVLSHTYATPGDCGADKLAVTYAAKCAKVEWKVTNTGGGSQKAELLKGDAVVATEWLPVGESAVFTTAATAGAVFKLRYFGTEFIIGDPFTYVEPASCATPPPAGSLPTTGARTGLYAGLGAGLLVLGVLAFFLARRRRVTGAE